MRTKVAVLGTAIALIGAVEAGAAAFKTGTYVGTTAQNRLIQFQVSKKKVKNISSAFVADCGDTDLNSEISGLSAKIDKKGRFTAKDQLGSVVKGRLKKSGAKGTLRFDYGPCDSGPVDWKAKRTNN